MLMLQLPKMHSILIAIPESWLLMAYAPSSVPVQSWQSMPSGMMPCSLVGKYRHFCGTYCLCLPILRMEAADSSKILVPTHQTKMHSCEVSLYINIFMGPLKTFHRILQYYRHCCNMWTEVTASTWTSMNFFHFQFWYQILFLNTTYCSMVSFYYLFIYLFKDTLLNA
jgi:hypothetical protein